MTPSWIKKIMTLLITSISLLLLISCAGNNIKTHLTVQSANYLNPDIQGHPSPVVLTIYELKVPFAFNKASYFKLSNNAAMVLGTHLIDKQTIEIRPGRKQTISQYITPATRYIGIIASYRNIDHANWRSLIKLPPKTKVANIDIHLESQGLTAQLQHGFKLPWSNL